MGPLIPLFWISGDVSSRVQSHSWQPYSHLAEVYLRFTSGATPADLLAVSMAAEPISYTYL